MIKDNDSIFRFGEPKLMTRIAARACDVNFNGDIFGGWIVSHMDMSGALAAMKVAHNRVATVAMDKLVFKKPVHVGDIIGVYATLKRIGNTSMDFFLEVYCRRHGFGQRELVTEAHFRFVAIDEQGRPKTIIRGEHIQGAKE